MSEEIDIMQNLDSLDLTNVETGVPVMKEGMVEVSVVEAKIERNKKDTGFNFNLKLALTQPHESLDGKVINPGFPIFHTISMVKTEKYNPLQNLASFRECFTGSKAGNFLPPEQYLGLTGQVRLKNETSEQYGTQTRVARFIKKA